ncbi:MAG: hypothetical protein WC612_04405 [Bdellovibrionales bacterium]|jgi:hypothetical protein
MTKKIDDFGFLLDLDEKGLREALSQSHHLKKIVGSPAQIKELLCVLHSLAQERAQELALAGGTTGPSFSTDPFSGKEALAHRWPRGSNVRPELSVAQAAIHTQIKSLDYGIDTATHFFGMYTAGRPDVFLFVPPAEKQPKKVERVVLDLTRGGYLTRPMWSDGHFNPSCVRKDERGQTRLLSVEDQGLFLSGQFKAFKKESPDKNLSYFSKLYVCDKMFSPLVHDGSQFLHRGDPKRQSNKLPLVCE